MFSELTPRARIPDTRIPQFMQPCSTFELPILFSCNKNVLLRVESDASFIVGSEPVDAHVASLSLNNGVPVPSFVVDHDDVAKIYSLYIIRNQKFC